ncbi:hypothetical protein [Paenibacillus sp. 453mf]|uniref:hypothetical protein n=1 Tax=Paenibacillus sp. 453mf TaxID=1761874 RepID=UPI00147CA068|nr:hypothetical protein [Paenibacillus sp. 453mf]
MGSKSKESDSTSGQTRYAVGNPAAAQSEILAAGVKYAFCFTRKRSEAVKLTDF